MTHHSQLATFKRQLRQAQEDGRDKAWEQLCSEAEAMLGPTMQLAHQLSNAYDQIRQQSEALETFTQGRTDPLTGVGNGRALEQQLRVLLNGAYEAIQLLPWHLSAWTAAVRTPIAVQAGVLSLLPKFASVDSHLHARQRFRRPLRRR